jgi:hypothetical protein
VLNVTSNERCWECSGSAPEELMAGRLNGKVMYIYVCDNTMSVKSKNTCERVWWMCAKVDNELNHLAKAQRLYWS